MCVMFSSAIIARGQLDVRLLIMFLFPVSPLYFQHDYYYFHKLSQTKTSISLTVPRFLILFFILLAILPARRTPSEDDWLAVIGCIGLHHANELLSRKKKHHQGCTSQRHAQLSAPLPSLINCIVAIRFEKDVCEKGCGGCMFQSVSSSVSNVAI